MVLKNVIACILLLIVVIYKVIVCRKKGNTKTVVARKEKRIVCSLGIISLLFFIIELVLSIINNGGDVSNREAISYFINALTIALIVFPINIIGLYKSMFKDEEKYCNLKTVVTNLSDKNIFKKLAKAHINVIYFGEEKELGLRELEENEVTKKDLSKSLMIKSNDIHQFDKWLDKDTVVYEKKDLSELYLRIMRSRQIYDNYIRIIKYIVITYLPVILSYVLLTMEGFPFVYDLLLIVILKIITMIMIEVLYKKLPYDKDIEVRYSKDKKILMGRQELLFMIAQGFINMFLMTIPYMLVMSMGGDILQAFSLYLLVFIYANIFGTYSFINDSFIVKIIWKNLWNIRVIFYIIIMILLSMVINFTHLFATMNVGLKNYFSCMMFGLATIAFNEIIKLARYRGKKGKKKNGIKNNKKSRRS